MKVIPIVFDIVEIKLIQFIIYKYFEFLEYLIQYPEKNDTNLPTDISLISSISKKCDENNISFKLKNIFGNHSQYNINFSEKEFKTLYDMLYMVLTIFTEEINTSSNKDKAFVLTNLLKLEKKLVAIKEAYNITGYKYTDKPLVKYPITDSRSSKKEKEQKNDLDDDAVLLLYELRYWSDETEKLAGETSRFIISREFFKKQEESYDIKLGKLWAIYQNLERLGYIKCGFENIPTGGRKNWYEITDKARLFFQDKEDNIVPGSLLIN